MEQARAESIRVLMMPDYRTDNPYQTLLARGLEAAGTNVTFPAGYRRVLPFSRAVKDTESDVLHLHWLEPYLRGSGPVSNAVYAEKILFDLSLLKKKGVRLIYTEHNGLSHDTDRVAIEWRLRKRLFALVHHVIVHSHAAKTLVCETFGVDEQKITVIPHGHYRSYYGPAPTRDESRKRLGIDTEGRVYLHFGMLRPYKGIENLLDAWKGHYVLNAQDRLFIAGRPIDDAYGAKLAQKAGQTPGVNLRIGYVSDDDVPVYFGASDVVILPFRRILTSGSLILAMSFDKPVIAPRTGGLAEVMEGAEDLMYDPDDPAALANALRVSTTLDLDELSGRVRIACNRLDWEGISKLTSEIYGKNK